MAARVLIDTNILLDYLLCREPFDKAAREVVLACKNGILTGCIAAHSISNMFFILRREFSVEERKRLLSGICKLFEIECIDKFKINNALSDNKFSDFEDCLQMECALSFGADYIVTRNGGDFKSSKIPCIEPGKLCMMLKNNK